MSTQTLRLILGDQLNARHPWFVRPDASVCYVMMEIRSETDYVVHHIQKVLTIFAAMRRFAQALQQAGHRVRYFKIGDPDNTQTIEGNLRMLLDETGAAGWACMEPDEWRVQQILEAAAKTLARPFEMVSTEHFLLTRAEAIRTCATRVPRMEFFYREMRRRYQLLLDADGQPVGGKWNFDASNRGRWQGQPQAPDWPWAAEDVSALYQEIQAAGVRTMGEVDPAALRWPVSRKQAKAGLQAFVQQVLPHFGAYQDAMSVHAPLLFHSALSVALNLKMLHPLEVVEAAIAAWQGGEAPIESVEGFVRQIIGWREFVRAVYWANMPDYAQLNALDATRPLPAWYWSGETRMNCVRHVVRQSLTLGYAHHIQRLMITGNFALLAGLHPDEVDAWYLGIYVDAFEWVEMPNTRGMALFADGGTVGSKPYAGGANYIKGQSDYCSGCHYDSKRRVGEGACPFNVLYWHFIDRHQDRFSANPRMAMIVNGWKKRPDPEKAPILATAGRYLERLDTL
ncbi:cryptochrome/photolyase family protein [Burkholderiaceae bacterium DAT-1]|nr:cryptochrome/photolyase family protein [Burkholderiaceae bacterium DAT-1]